MFIIYDLVFLLFALIYLPSFLLKKKLHRGFIQRLGAVKFDTQLDKPIWVHAVSVGEAKAAQYLTKQLRKTFPEKKFVFSTVTPTGNSIVRRFKQQDDFLFYLPLDLSFITRRVIRKIDPCVCIIMETEIWPNLISGLKQKGVPIIVVNARISDRSFLGYRLIKPLLKQVLNKIDLFCVQSATDAQRLEALGMSGDKLKITGNMKYDIAGGIDSEVDFTKYRLRLGLSDRQRLFVAGSTHASEEEIILRAYLKLTAESCGLRLLIAPRHPERTLQIEALVKKFGFIPLRISKLSISAGICPPDAVFILDTVGELIAFYSVCDIVFVGGSLVSRGGQNILEPALFAKPILFGPHMFNFRDISNMFLIEKAACMVQTEEELLKEISFLLSNPNQAQSMGQVARRLVVENQGVALSNAQLIKQTLDI